MYRDVPEYVITLCKSLRESSTPPEQALWRCLRNRRLGGLKFRRQHPVGRYIADLYCEELRLIVETDGRQHGSDEQAEKDYEKDRTLRDSNYRVVRFTADEVSHNLERVLMTILEMSAPSPPTPLPKGEGRKTHRT